MPDTESLLSHGDRIRSGFLSNDHSQLPLAREEKSTPSNMTKSTETILMDVKEGAMSGRRCEHRRHQEGLDALQGKVHSKVGEDHVSACALDRTQAFTHHTGFINSPRLSAELDHRVLTADLIGSQRQA